MNDGRINYGEEVRTVRELLRVLACGGRLIRHETWQRTHETGCREFHVVMKDGSRRIVQTSIAVAACRKGLVVWERLEPIA